MNLNSYKELLDRAKEARIGQIVLKLELRLFSLNGVTSDQRAALKEAEDEIRELFGK